MADEYSGKPPLLGQPRSANTSRLNLYLPEYVAVSQSLYAVLDYEHVARHHYVETVAFKTASGKPLHNALAALQTPSREYLILRETGLTVGCEEDGLAPVWMDLLQCDERGIALRM